MEYYNQELKEYESYLNFDIEEYRDRKYKEAHKEYLELMEDVEKCPYDFNKSEFLKKEECEECEVYCNHSPEIYYTECDDNFTPIIEFRERLVKRINKRIYGAGEHSYFEAINKYSGLNASLTPSGAISLKPINNDICIKTLLKIAHFEIIDERSFKSRIFINIDYSNAPVFAFRASYLDYAYILGNLISKTYNSSDDGILALNDKARLHMNQIKEESIKLY